jgi:hypothetical protein
MIATRHSNRARIAEQSHRMSRMQRHLRRPDTVNPRSRCVDGRRIVSECQVRGREGRSAVALRHVREETLDDYLFDRLGGRDTGTRAPGSAKRLVVVGP